MEGKRNTFKIFTQIMQQSATTPQENDVYIMTAVYSKRIGMLTFVQQCK